MRKIKLKPFKPPKKFKFKPSPDVEYVVCYPIEGALFDLNEFDRHDRERTWNTIMANLRGEPVATEPNYFGEVPTCLRRRVAVGDRHD